VFFLYILVFQLLQFYYLLVVWRCTLSIIGLFYLYLPHNLDLKNYIVQLSVLVSISYLAFYTSEMVDNSESTRFSNYEGNKKTCIKYTEFYIYN